MGLDCSHDAWHGPYSQFMRWRERLCEAAGLPPLRLMEGFYTLPSDPLGPFDWSVCQGRAPLREDVMRGLPIRWACLDVDPALVALLSHSDCEGDLEHRYLAPLADILEELAEKMPDAKDDPEARDGASARGIYDGVKAATLRFAAGCRMAAQAMEDLRFR